jgi:hypothetical protein
MNKPTNLARTLVLTGNVLLSNTAMSADNLDPQRAPREGVLVASVSSPPKLAQGDDSIAAFWEKFKVAVIRGDKRSIQSLSQFPIEMPYGMPPIRTRTQLLKRYRDVFNHETNAANCFRTAQPETDPARPKEFTVACKNSAVDEVIIYSFKRTGKSWAFAGLDNINE